MHVFQCKEIIVQETSGSGDMYIIYHTYILFSGILHFFSLVHIATFL